MGAMSDSDIVAITQLVNLYGLAVDSQRWQLFDRIFAADVDADYGPTSRWTDREQFKSEFAAFHDPFDCTQYTMSTHVVHVDGDRAHSFCNGSWRLVRNAADGNPLVNETIAGVKFDLATTVLRREADAGRVGILTAVTE
jgi:SnoaL-like domain